MFLAKLACGFYKRAYPPSDGICLSIWNHRMCNEILGPAGVRFKPIDYYFCVFIHYLIYLYTTSHVKAVFSKIN